MKDELKKAINEFDRRFGKSDWWLGATPYPRNYKEVKKFVKDVFIFAYNLGTKTK
jgi:hypothetical protein